MDIDAVDYLKLDMDFKRIVASGMDEGRILVNYKDLNFGPPILNSEGIKVQPNWLFQFLTTPYPIRPLTKATMPTFNLTEDEVVNLVGFFQARDDIISNPFFTAPELQRIETDTAENTVGTSVLFVAAAYLQQMTSPEATCADDALIRRRFAICISVRLIRVSLQLIWRRAKLQ